MWFCKNVGNYAVFKQFYTTYLNSNTILFIFMEKLMTIWKKLWNSIWFHLRKNKCPTDDLLMTPTDDFFWFVFDGSFQWLPLTGYHLFWPLFSKSVLYFKHLLLYSTRMKLLSKYANSIWWLYLVTTSNDYLLWLPPVTTSGDYLRWLPPIATAIIWRH